MQYLNDDNMDELFRRAADDYPLNTNSKNWDKVISALQTEKNDAISDKNNSKYNRYRKYLWLLLLLPMAWICNGKFFMNDSKQGDDQVTAKIAEQPKTTSGTKTKKAADKNYDSKSTQLSNTQNNSSEKDIASSKTQRGLKSDQAVQLADAPSIDKSKTAIDRAIDQNQQIKSTNRKSVIPLNLKDNHHSQKDKSGFSKNKMDRSTLVIADNTNNIDDAVTKNNLGTENKVNNSDSEIKNADNLSGSKVESNQSSDAPAVENSGKIHSAQKQVVQQTDKKNSLEKNKTHFFYAGVVGGVDVSTVKFQSVNNTGYTAGILLGYQLNKKLSIESGFLVDKKYYYTDGKDFDTKKLTLYPGWTIQNVMGSCLMFELPINIKYNWTSTTQSNWFSTLGMSSYFMKNENYVYSIKSPVSTIPWSQGESYSNSSVNWFGVINLSGGYMHTLGKAGSLRVEPYVKIPFQGLGIGSLSVWSTGIYVSFIKKIF